MTAHKYDIKAETKKIIFQYTIVAMASLLIGGCFSYLISNGILLTFGEEIKNHFLLEIKPDRQLDSILIYTAYYSLFDLLCVFLGFCFTFSIFNYLASDIILLCKGFSVGFSTAVFYRCVSQYSVTDYRSLIIFAILKIFTLIFITVFLCGLSIHSVQLKIFLPNYRFKLEIKSLLFIILYTICGVGTAFILNAIYCFLIFIL